VHNELAPLHRADRKPKDHGDYSRVSLRIAAKAARSEPLGGRLQAQLLGFGCATANIAPCWFTDMPQCCGPRTTGHGQGLA
jgi:hypothetical protein